MLILRNISYRHPNKNLLFSGVDLAVNRHQKTALIGKNGTGKSILLNIITGILRPSRGEIITQAEPYHVQQSFGQFNDMTIAQALHIEGKLNALKAILNGSTCEENFNLLNEDWAIEDRCAQALDHWDLNHPDLAQKMGTLSGGEQTKVFLAGISIHQPELVLLDEPSNHLDLSGRKLLYEYIQSTNSTLIVVSHDRKLLNLLNITCELKDCGIKTYGGNYNFYKAQKQVEHNALIQDIQNKEKSLRKAKEKQRVTLQRQQRSDSRGKSKKEKAGVARIMMNTLRNNAENSTSKLKGVHTERIAGISKELRKQRALLPGMDKMKFGFDHSDLHAGKVLIRATGVNFAYASQPLWTENLSFQITSGERIVLKGGNGSGKTTLIKLILGNLEPQTGRIYRAENKAVYIDQDYSLIEIQENLYQQACKFNTSGLQEHEIKIRLDRFLFAKDDWDKPCSVLSGGERMRLMLCCLSIGNRSPEMIILDEPTNNLDIENVEILIHVLNDYQGTLLVVSHDETFLEALNISRKIEL